MLVSFSRAHSSVETNKNAFVHVKAPVCCPCADLCFCLRKHLQTTLLEKTLHNKPKFTEQIAPSTVRQRLQIYTKHTLIQKQPNTLTVMGWRIFVPFIKAKSNF